MNKSKIDIEETHLRITCDLDETNLKSYIYSIRRDLKNYILLNKDFLLSLDPLDEIDDDLPLIVKTMIESSTIADVGPMACVAGTISQLCLNYLIDCGSKYSIVENGGDIAIINDRKFLCGIYSNNSVLGNNIAFEIKKQEKPFGISTSSGKIGHSISFGDADTVTVISKSPSIADGIATNIANNVCGSDSEQKVSNALEIADNYKKFFQGVLIICDGHVGTTGRLPKIVETNEFNITY